MTSVHTPTVADIKYRLLGILRVLGLLSLADSLKYWLARLRVALPNNRFRVEHPDFILPPYRLAFDAYNTLSWPAYHDVGLLHAQVFAGQIVKAYPEGPIRVLEWGCGPGRIIRHLTGILGSRVELTGTDYNQDTIDWCRSAFPEIQFELNHLLPPLHLASDGYDAIFNFSVFTHLSLQAQLAWSQELLRMLKPGGLLICTTHGDNYRHLLVRANEIEAYDTGQVVVQGNYREGRKWFLAVHPSTFVSNELLKGYCEIRKVSVPAESQLLQDVWIARKPLASAHSGGSPT